MDNLMPINKQSIQQLMQQAYDLGTEDMETLCLMNRKQYQVTADSVAQFSAYRNGTHSLLARVETFSNQIPELLETLAGNVVQHCCDVWREAFKYCTCRR